MTQRTLLQETKDGVLLLTLNRPEAKNAFNLAMYKELATVIREAPNRQDISAIVITGAGDAFSAGQDLGEMMQITDDSEVGFVHALEALVDCDLPILGAVNGVGIGFGTTMLLHMDIVHIAEGARLRCPFVPLGVPPEAASSLLLPLAVGLQRASELLFTGRWISAAEAVEYGLALKQVAPESLLPGVMELATAIAKQPRAALITNKRLVREPLRKAVRDTHQREVDQFAVLLNAPENRAALEAFMTRKK